MHKELYMSDCTHDCGSCSKDCSSRITFEKQNPLSDVKKVIGIVSGKGGVGKSLVTSLLAVGKAREGKNVAILDADITGPSFLAHSESEALSRGTQTEYTLVKAIRA